MKAGLLGPPQSGKSTLFAALTGFPIKSAAVSQEHTACIKVPDERLSYLADIHKPEKIVEAVVDIGDFPGFSSHEEHGQQQYKKHLPEIRLCDVLVAVVRDFESDSVAKNKDRLDPQADLDDIYEDFILADLETVATRSERLEHSLKKPTKTRDQKNNELALLQRCQEALNNLQPLSTVLQNQEEAVLLRSFAFLTQKPLIAVVNVSEDRAATPATLHHKHFQVAINICADAEEQITELDEADREEFLADLGIESPARDQIIRACYSVAGLISFLTVGKDEVRAWPIPQGTIAVQAAGKVHSDIERGFIRAETVSYQDLVASGGDMKAVKAAANLRQEGKTYIVQDGDIIFFKFNV